MNWSHCSNIFISCESPESWVIRKQNVSKVKVQLLYTSEQNIVWTFQSVNIQSGMQWLIQQQSYLFIWIKMVPGYICFQVTASIIPINTHFVLIKSYIFLMKVWIFLCHQYQRTNWWKEWYLVTFIKKIDFSHSLVLCNTIFYKS